MKKTLLSLLAISALVASDNVHQLNASQEEAPATQSAPMQTQSAPAMQNTQSTHVCPTPAPAACNCNAMEHNAPVQEQSSVLEANSEIRISVIGEGVAPMNTASPAQAYALAKRAAIADAYRQIAEKVKGVRIEGQDLIKNMMVKRSTIRTSVNAMVRDANIVETTFKEGLCEVEMEIVLTHSQFVR